MMNKFSRFKQHLETGPPPETRDKLRQRTATSPSVIKLSETSEISVIVFMDKDTGGLYEIIKIVRVLYYQSALNGRPRIIKKKPTYKTSSGVPARDISASRNESVFELNDPVEGCKIINRE